MFASTNPDKFINPLVQHVTGRLPRAFYHSSPTLHPPPQALSDRLAVAAVQSEGTGAPAGAATVRWPELATVRRDVSMVHDGRCRFREPVTEWEEWPDQVGPPLACQRTLGFWHRILSRDQLKGIQGDQFEWRNDAECHFCRPYSK